MTAADLDPTWEGRTIAIHHNRRHHVGKVLRVGAADGMVQIDLDTGWHDVPPGTVVTEQEVPF